MSSTATNNLKNRKAMKSIVLFTCTALLIVNILFCLLLTDYSGVQVLLSNGIIIISGILTLLISVLPLKEGFKSSLYVVYPILGFIEIVLSLFSPNRIVNSWVIAVIMLMIVFQLIFLFVINVISNKIQ